MGLGEVTRVGNLPRHPSHGRAEVIDAIPDLGDDDDPGSTIAKADVDRQRGVLRLRRQLEAPIATVRGGKPKHEFLCSEVSCILRLGHDISAEPDRQRPRGG
jgi:hypothetical protein